VQHLRSVFSWVDLVNSWFYGRVVKKYKVDTTLVIISSWSECRKWRLIQHSDGVACGTSPTSRYLHSSEHGEKEEGKGL